MRNIAIIPARSGSKGVPHKNIRPLAGVPLMGYTIRAAEKAGVFDTIMVSTDSEDYAAVARQYGADVPFLRSAAQSTDSADSWSVVKEVLNAYKEKGQTFDTVCLLQPTSPLRDEADIREGYRLFEEQKADAVTSVCEAEHSPLWCMTLEENRSLDAFRENLPKGPRQNLSQYYRLNGAVYIRRIRYEKDGVEIIHSNEFALVMDATKSVDIDTALDFKMAEFLIQSENKLFPNNGGSQ